MQGAARSRRLPPWPRTPPAVAPAFDVGGLGRMAMAADGMGTQFGLWEAGTHPGGGVTGQPGSLTWTELRTRSRAPAAAFYEAVFGWEVQSVQSGADATATLAEGLGGEVRAPPHDGPGLRLAVLRDPLGALFYVVEPKTPSTG